MARETISRCSRCKQEDCDGREWRILPGQGVGTFYDSFFCCTHLTEIRSGKRQYHFVRGHGDDWWVNVEEIKE